MANQQRLNFPLDQNSYKIVAEIGAGVSAVVYKALCLPLNSVPVAIKSIDLDSRRRSPSSSESSSDHNLDEARREAKTMSLLSHPNILTAHCSFAVGRRLWVVMPFMSGGSLASILTSSFPSGLPEPAVTVVLRETLNALSYLHAQGHLHRDVKAGNILVDATSGTGGGASIKLADFGVSASIYDSPFPLTDIAGTPYWMAPEVIHSRSTGGYGVKADIWSFGITALELAQGKPPFSNLPLSDSLLMKLTKKFQFSDFDENDNNNNNNCNKGKKLSKAFKEMVALCLNQEPSKRPTAERLLKHSFFKGSRGLEFLAKHVLHGLPSVEERFRAFKTCNNNVLVNHNLIDGHDIDSDEDGDGGGGGGDLKEKRRRISGWNFNEDVLGLGPFLGNDSAAVKQVRFGGETLIDRSSTAESSPSPNPSLRSSEAVEGGGVDKERVVRDVASLRRNLEAERKTLAEILRLLGTEEGAETREECLEKAVEALRSELENERRRNSELEMEVEFLKMEIQRS